jgi:hypothetical protein
MPSIKDPIVDSGSHASPSEHIPSRTLINAYRCNSVRTVAACEQTQVNG